MRVDYLLAQCSVQTLSQDTAGFTFMGKKVCKISRESLSSAMKPISRRQIFDDGCKEEFIRESHNDAEVCS